MKTAAIYPFDAGLLPIVRHFHEFQDKYELRSVISTPGAGLTGKDAAWACNQPELNITVGGRADMESEKWKTLLLAGDHIVDTVDIVAMIKEAVKRKKEVIYFSHSRKSIPRQVAGMFEKEPLVNFSVQEDLLWDNTEITGFDAIKTPVILVGGLLEKADVLETTLAVTGILKKTGLSAITVTKEAVAGCFGFYDFSMWYSQSADLPNRILEINKAIREIERREMPDAIVIEAPDAMIRYNNLVPNGFGIYAYLLCQAVRPDYIICCMPYDLAEDAYIELLDKDFKVRLGAEICAVHASNLLVDSMDLMQSKKMEVFYDDFAAVNFTAIKEKRNHAEKSGRIPKINVIDDPEGLERILRALMSEEA